MRSNPPKWAARAALVVLLGASVTSAQAFSLWPWHHAPAPKPMIKPLPAHPVAPAASAASAAAAATASARAAQGMVSAASSAGAGRAQHLPAHPVDDAAAAHDKKDLQTVHTLSALQSQLLVVKQQIEEQRLRLELAQSQQTLRTLHDQIHAADAAAKAPASGQVQIGVQAPRVIAIAQGAATPIYAQVVLPSGGILTIHPHDKLPGDWTVKEISSKAVDVVDASGATAIWPLVVESRTVGSAVESAAPASETGAFALPQVPPVPPLPSTRPALNSRGMAQ